MTNLDKQLLEEIIRKMPVFRKFSESLLQQVLVDFRMRRYKKGQTVVYQSDETTELYVILHGRMQVTLWSMTGEEFILADLHKGDFFGEMSIVDGAPRSATVVATKDSILAFLQRENFLQIIQQEPKVALDLLKFLVKRLRKADEMIECFAFLDVRRRLENQFVQLIMKKEEKDGNGYYKLKKLTHQELASRTGASREAVSKVLKVMSLKNLVNCEGDCLLISPDIYKRKDRFMHNTLM